MAFQPQHFGEGFGIGGEIGFHTWWHTTDSDLPAVLKPGYFNGPGGLLRPGDLIWLGISRRFDRARPWEFDPTTVQRFLLMVRPSEKGLVRVRVVMALGSPVDEDLPVQGAAAVNSPPTDPASPRGRPVTAPPALSAPVVLPAQAATGGSNGTGRSARTTGTRAARLRKPG